MPPTLQLVPTERAPTQRRIDEPAAEGVLAVEGLQQVPGAPTLTLTLALALALTPSLTLTLAIV